MRWKEVARFRFQIKAEEGLRIGGSGGGLEIGGVDLVAIRNPATGEPYLPGSSLKGKMRSLLEKAEGKVTDNGEPCSCGEQRCLVCRIFGAHKKPNAPSAPTRVVVRDGLLSEASRKQFQERVQAGQPILEEKTENIVNRKSGTAEHPRTSERVFPGTVFDGEILLHIYETDNQEDMVKFIRRGLGLIQEASSLGASGSRGYGKVKFENLKVEKLDVEKITL